MLNYVGEGGICGFIICVNITYKWEQVGYNKYRGFSYHTRFVVQNFFNLYVMEKA